MLFSGSSIARNGIEDPSKLIYKDWGDHKPSIMTINSGELLPLALRGDVPFKIFWWTTDKKPVESMKDVVCKIKSCAGDKHYPVIIEETYLGDASKFIPGQISDITHIGVNSLKDVPPGAKKVLYARVAFRSDLGMTIIETISIAFDDVSDDDLRQATLEQGVYQIMLWHLK
jgi:hypothetical protein